MAPGYGNYWWGPIHFPSITPESDDIEGLFKGLHEWLTTALAVVAIGQALGGAAPLFLAQGRRAQEDVAVMAKRLTAAALALLLMPGLGLANCYRANGDDGELRFNGVAEGDEVTGSFHEFSVSLCMDGNDLATADIEVTVQTASVDTGDSMRDSELRGDHFFNVGGDPEATWVSSRVASDGDGFVAQGTLTLRGIDKNQAVRLRLSDGEPPVLTGSANILRLKWGVGTGDDYQDTDFIRNRVDLEFELRLQPYSEG